MARSIPNLDDWLTTEEVAELFQVHPRVVLRMIREGRLSAEKKGWVWLLYKDELPATWPPPLAS